jgi:uncharacterized protein
MHPSLRETTHRPWPLPQREWTWRQSWLDRAFIHYRVDQEQLRAKLPDGLRLQKFDGSAWVALVAFRTEGMMHRPFPAIPMLSGFLELNLRTYVEAEGKAGVWFFSLDANSWPMVFAGRAFFGVPYHYARMAQEMRNGWFDYSCERVNGSARFHGRYRGVSEPFYPKRGSFEHWVAERYCLYSCRARVGLVRTEVHHPPWPMRKAEVEIFQSTIPAAAGIRPAEEKPTCHFSTGVQVVSYSSEAMAGQSPDASLAPGMAPAGQELRWRQAVRGAPA